MRSSSGLKRDLRPGLPLVAVECVGEGVVMGVVVGVLQGEGGLAVSVTSIGSSVANSAMLKPKKRGDDERWKRKRLSGGMEQDLSDGFRGKVLLKRFHKLLTFL